MAAQAFGAEHTRQDRSRCEVDRADSPALGRISCAPKAEMPAVRIAIPHDRRSKDRGCVNPSVEHSLRLDVRRLDDRPPLLDLGLLLRGERLRRLFVARPQSLT